MENMVLSARADRSVSFHEEEQVHPTTVRDENDRRIFYRRHNSLCHSTSVDDSSIGFSFSFRETEPSDREVTMKDEHEIRKFFRRHSSLHHSISRSRCSGDDSDEQEGVKKTGVSGNAHTWIEVFLIVWNLSVLSIAGESFRVFLGRLFGSECTDEVTAWLHDIVQRLNLCVTTDGQSSRQGGALFVDLPANMVGSFIMGLIQPCQDLGLFHSSFPVAFLSSRHWFQSWHVAHLTLRTGFCGSLTTFASWNTQMVQMIYETNFGGSQFFSALFGYILGLAAALASLVLGQTVAVWFHRYNNPVSAKTEDVLLEFPQSDAAYVVCSMNKSIPDFERRYLDSLFSGEEMEWAKRNLGALDELQRWRDSTSFYRKNDGSLMPDYHVTRHCMHEIERSILVDGKQSSEILLTVSDALGWNVNALQAWATETSSASTKALLSTLSMPAQNKSFSFAKVIGAALPSLLAILLLAAYVSLGEMNVDNGFYRSMWLSAILAPLGTVVRWRLSSLNGAVDGNLHWFPLGTFIANLSASVVSIVVVGIDAKVGEGHSWAKHLLTALKTGFAGSMSTVSTLVIEGQKLNATFPHHAKGHYYMLASIVVACVLGVATYAVVR